MRLLSVGIFKTLFYSILLNGKFYFYRYGEVVNINLIRDKLTGKQKGFCFLCYEDQRSTILAVDNFNGIKVRFFMYFVEFKILYYITFFV